MARVSTESSSASCEPPRLPEYLKNVYDLKPIIGIPSDEEVMGIHAVIRAAYNVSQVPGMFDPALSMRLAQHLFEVQMARYRDKHPLGIFSGDTVYTPPALPSHVPVTLRPVAGAPSDDEMQGVHAAVRAYEHFVNVPSMFDPRVGMELSQHLCNIQIARYMQHVALGQAGVQRLQSDSRDEEPTGSSGSTRQAQEPLESARDTVDEATPVILAEENIEGASHGTETQQHPTRGIVPLVESQSPLGLGIPNESKQSLDKLVDTMENVGRILIGTQNSFVRSARSTLDTWRCYTSLGASELINGQGERPAVHGLPAITRRYANGNYFRWSTSVMTDEQLARYMVFYGVGGDLIENGDTLTIKDGRRNDAENVLLNFVN